jgi:hypothetical protein
MAERLRRRGVPFKCPHCKVRAEVCLPPDPYFNLIDASAGCVRGFSTVQVNRCPSLWPEYLKADRKLREMT